MLRAPATPFRSLVAALLTLLITYQRAAGQAYYPASAMPPEPHLTVGCDSPGAGGCSCGATASNAETIVVNDDCAVCQRLGFPSASYARRTDGASDGSKYPATIHPMPRPGIFPVPPANGPDYFTLWNHLRGEREQKRPKSGYAPFAINAWPFFDADWRYVDGLAPAERDVVERLKRLRLGDSMLFSTGGELWLKHHSEHNSRLTNTDNDFNLSHARLYGDFSYQDLIRVYGEYVWAGSSSQSLPPLPTDIDRGDILDLFVDVKTFSLLGQPVYARVGRQELLYGSQRLVTPLPWANKRHSFQGVKVFRHGEHWDLDAFWTQYVPPNAGEFDQPDEDLLFAGAWATHKPRKGETIDLYYLMFKNDKAASQNGIVRAPFETHTLGTRWAGDQNGWLWDAEGAIQCGTQGSSDLLSGMTTVGLGHHWKGKGMSPTAWIYYDYASGDGDPSAGKSNTFNQQFPFGHYYMGWMDLVGRQNIHDVNAHLYLYPAPWMTVCTQYHRFWLAESRDALYNPGGVPYRRDPTGAAGSHVGDEVDLIVNFHLTKYSDILVSYNKLFGGRFLEQTAGPTTSADAESLYFIFQQRF